MSRIGKISLTLAGFGFLFVAVPRVFLEEWNNYLFIPLIGFLVFFTVAVIKDFRFYLEFFTMKTTKHGANMGVLILMALVLLATANYLGMHFLGNVKFDWTKEQLNSLAEQSVKVVKGLDSDLEVKFFFGRGIQNVNQVKEQFKNLVRLYSDKSKFVKVEFVDSIRQPDIAEEFKVDSGDSVIYVRYKGVRQRVEKIDEEGLTNAIVKLTHTKTRMAYFVSGHGERDINSKEPTGLYDLKQALEGSQYTVKPLKLFEEGRVPVDADVVFIVGPQQSYQENELEALRAFARASGKFLIALDPGMHHNLAGLVKTFGVEFDNNFIVDPVALRNTNALAVFGTDYSRSSELTKSFNPNMVSMFYLASSLKRAGTAPASLHTDEVVKTGAKAFVSAEMPHQGAKFSPEAQGAKTVVMTVTGSVEAAAKPDPAKKDAPAPPAPGQLIAVIAGDSDYLSNQFLPQFINRDLALNSVAYLARDTDLISIRPKVPGATPLTLSSYQVLALLLMFLMLPIVMLMSGGVVWLRRKNA